MSNTHPSKAAALALLESGFEPLTVAHRLNLNHNTVRGWASKAGLTKSGMGKAATPKDSAQPLPMSPSGVMEAHHRQRCGGAGSIPASGSNSVSNGGVAPQLKGQERNPTSPRRKPTHLVIPDTQCKPGENLDHLYWAGRYAAERKPDTIIHLGDHWDMPSLSSYEKRGSKWFEGRRVKEDIDAGNTGLHLFEQGLLEGGWQPKRKVLLRGNHEDRVTRWLSENPSYEGLMGFQDFDDEKLGWEVFPFLTPIEIDGVTYAHYFYNPSTGRSYSGSVDTMLRNIGFTFTMGHQQGRRVGARELTNGRTLRGLVCGSYYQHDEEYRGPQARFEWRGLMVCHEVHDGDYDLMEVSIDFLKERYGNG